MPCQLHSKHNKLQTLQILNIYLHITSSFTMLLFFLQLFSNFDTSSNHLYVGVLCSYMAADYKSESERTETPFLRGLKTSQFAGVPSCPYLEQPNIISGLPAQGRSPYWMHHIWYVLHYTRVASGLEKSGKFDIFSRSGKCQGILKIGQWKIKIPKSQGKVREKSFWRTHFSFTSTCIGYCSLLALNI